MTDSDDVDQKTVVRRGYDAMAADYDEARSPDEFPDDLWEPFCEALGDDGLLLDAGCGAARGPLSRLPAGVAGVGLDVSRAQLRLARERSDAAFLAGDMVGLPFVPGVFDGLTAFYSTIHVPLDEHPELYREFARVLRPGGVLLCTVNDGAWSGENDDWLGTGEQMAWSFPSEEATRDLLAAAGFEVIGRTVVRSEVDDDFWPFLLCRLTEGEGGE